MLDRYIYINRITRPTSPSKCLFSTRNLALSNQSLPHTLWVRIIVTFWLQFSIDCLPTAVCPELSLTSLFISRSQKTTTTNLLLWAGPPLPWGCNAVCVAVVKRDEDSGPLIVRPGRVQCLERRGRCCDWLSGVWESCSTSPPISR